MTNFDKALIARAEKECPDLKIRHRRPRSYAGPRRMMVTKKRHRMRAVEHDVCHCTMANCATEAFKVPLAIFEYGHAYLLEPCGDGWHEWVKYAHDGRPVAKELDEGGVGVWNTIVTFRAVSKSRKPGAQTATQKAGLPNKRRQSKEHVAKRAAGIKASARRRIAV